MGSEMCIRDSSICMEGVFLPGMKHYHPPDDFESASLYFGSAVERSTSYAEVPGSSPTFRAFFCLFYWHNKHIPVPGARRSRVRAFFFVGVGTFFVFLFPGMEH